MKKHNNNNRKPYKEDSYLEFQNTNIPIAIFYEPRKGYRFSFTQKGVNLRVPIHSSQSYQQQAKDRCKQWMQSVLQEKPELLARYHVKTYKSGHRVHLFDKTYTLKLNYHDKTTICSKIDNDFVHISIPSQECFAIIEPKHLSKMFAQHYRAFFQERLNEWNEFFPIRHNKLRLKFNSSNWGSCSSKRNINLSTRLLLCPERVIDYVIVHELAHLIQQNHSCLFWDEVARVMPNYKEQSLWLKTKGMLLDF